MAGGCSCNDFNRAQLLRRGVAAAGRGLPKIEPGMPVPAGTGMDRRTFMLRSAGAALSVYGASMLSPRHLEEGIAQAAAAARQPAGARVDLHGRRLGCAVGARARRANPSTTNYAPQLARNEGSGKTFSEDETLMWHPSAAGLAELHEEGKVTAFPAVGYDPPDESHFTSRHYWEVGQLDTNTRTGWMGR